jgi:hypothetical protein
MPLALALLSKQSFALQLYAATLNGRSIQELSLEHRMPVHLIQERLYATWLALTHQVGLLLNPDSPLFEL